jgi:hypothetical protein
MKTRMLRLAALSLVLAAGDRAPGTTAAGAFEAADGRASPVPAAETAADPPAFAERLVEGRDLVEGQPAEFRAPRIQQDTPPRPNEVGREGKGRGTWEDHFLLEAVWVIFRYGWWSLACGLALSSVMVVWGSRRVHRRARLTVLAAATLVLWIALVVGVEYGYATWQGVPDPPEEAFSDTGGPGAVLLAGWLPSLVVLGMAHLVLRRRWRASPAGATPSPGTPTGSDRPGVD